VGGGVVTKHEAQIHVAVLKRLLRGEPVDPDSLSGATGLTPEIVGAALVALDSAGAFHLSGGTLVAAYPLSAVPTRHRLRIGRSVTYANCAVDALAVPSMADGRVDVESQCAQCGTAITIQMIGDRVLAAQPETPVVFHVASDCCEAGPPVLTRCPHINFFCGQEHARRWLAAHAERRGDILSLPQAIVRAREIFDRVISSAGGAR
jgi:hypothetical protein